MIALSCAQWAAAAWFVAMWVVVGVHDAREQKIAHRHLAWIAGFSGLIYLALLLHSAAGARGWVSPFLQASFYRDALLHASLSATAGLILWRLRMWPAGDAKLFAALAPLIPVVRLSSGFDPRRSFFFALVNVFVPAAVVTVIRASAFVWRLYLNEQRRALVLAGWFRLRAQLAEAAPTALRAAVAGAAGRLRAWALEPVRAASSLVAWAGSVSFSSVVAVVVARWAPSAFIQSGACYLAMLAFGKAAAGRRRLPLSVLSLSLSTAAGAIGGPVLIRQCLPFLGNLTAFSLFLRLGTGVVRRLLEERGILVAPLFFLIGALPLGLLFSFGSQGGRVIVEWALLGALFGLGRVLVAVLEREDCPKVPPSQLRSFSVLAPTFVEELRGDPAFFEEHFEALYADGLTPEQVQAVKEWCEVRGVELVRLHSTVSFANWIFLGFFLTWLFPVSVLHPLP